MRLNSRGFRQITKGRSLGILAADQPARVHAITPNNAFSYSLPVLSRTAVNQVNYEYGVLELANEEDASKSIRVRLRDCVIEGNIITANVPLGGRVWERIERVRVAFEGRPNIDLLRSNILDNSSANILRIRFAEINTAGNNRFEVYINAKD